MADFYQDGVLTTLHRLAPNQLGRLEADLSRFVRNKPIGLVLPALYSEFESPAMQRIVTDLQQVQYLERIVVVVGRATQEQFEHTKTFFQKFYTPVSLIWIEGARTQDFFKKLEDRGIPAGPDGKGRSYSLRAAVTSSRCTTATLSTTTASCSPGCAIRWSTRT
jgi:glucosyl-3-phosphoglycerate synthase